MRNTPDIICGKESAKASGPVNAFIIQKLEKLELFVLNIFVLFGKFCFKCVHSSLLLLIVLK